MADPAARLFDEASRNLVQAGSTEDQGEWGVSLEQAVEALKSLLAEYGADPLAADVALDMSALPYGLFGIADANRVLTKGAPLDDQMRLEGLRALFAQLSSIGGTDLDAVLHRLMLTRTMSKWVSDLTREDPPSTVQLAQEDNQALSKEDADATQDFRALCDDQDPSVCLLLKAEKMLPDPSSVQRDNAVEQLLMAMTAEGMAIERLDDLNKIKSALSRRTVIAQILRSQIKRNGEYKQEPWSLSVSQVDLASALIPVIHELFDAGQRSDALAAFEDLKVIRVSEIDMLDASEDKDVLMARMASVYARAGSFSRASLDLKEIEDDAIRDVGWRRVAQALAKDGRLPLAGQALAEVKTDERSLPGYCAIAEEYAQNGHLANMDLTLRFMRKRALEIGADMSELGQAMAYGESLNCVSAPDAELDIESLKASFASSDARDSLLKARAYGRAKQGRFHEAEDDLNAIGFKLTAIGPIIKIAVQRSDAGEYTAALGMLDDVSTLIAEVDSDHLQIMQDRRLLKAYLDLSRFDLAWARMQARDDPDWKRWCYAEIGRALAEQN